LLERVKRPFLTYFLKMNLNNALIKLTAFFNKLLRLLLPLVAVSLLLGIIFGPNTAFVGDVYKNVTDILNMLGEDSLLALVSIIIILIYLKKD